MLSWSVTSQAHAAQLILLLPAEMAGITVCAAVWVDMIHHWAGRHVDLHKALLDCRQILLRDFNVPKCCVTADLHLCVCIDISFWLERNSLNNQSGVPCQWGVFQQKKVIF